MSQLSIILFLIGIMSLGTAAPAGFRAHGQGEGKWRPQRTLPLPVGNRQIRLVGLAKEESLDDEVTKYITKIGTAVLCSNGRGIDYGGVFQHLLGLYKQKDSSTIDSGKAIDEFANLVQEYMEGLVGKDDGKKNAVQNNPFIECP